MGLKEMLIYVVQQLVDRPEDVKVNEVSGGRSIILELKVNQGDVGKVIGRQGKTADALRTLLKAMAGKTGRRGLMLEIIEE